MDSVAVGVTCGYYSWIYDFVSDFNSELPENFFRSQSAYIYTFYSDFCSSINDIPCNIRRRSCSDIKYEI